MSGEDIVERVARRLATSGGRRGVLAGAAAGLAVALGVAAGEPEAAAGGRSRRGCSRDRDCGFGEACRSGQCHSTTGFAKRDERCHTAADCSNTSGPTVCERGAVCSMADTVIPPYQVCRGGFKSESGAAAT